MAKSYTAGKIIKINGSTKAPGDSLDANDIASVGHMLRALIQNGDIKVAGEAADKRRMAFLGVRDTPTNDHLLTTEMFRGR